ncbi:hypothetical protein BDV28DRAFT_141068 [Aspergillus coremiiformis]|uniref:Uncharacterized protein n=1 Tax=Aspergillus coremiiformis TaxID=138285 RepID=A0A5N6YVM5_9EURO|nr:hypothetical protein BDV28DRAFT_141068 [Aspergillus coremiiformis]
MRVSRIFNSLIGSFIVVNLLPYVLVVTAFRLDFLTYNLPYHLFQRSLPGLLITAPAGAVGYQPPPGPVPNNALPIETGAVAEKGPQGLSQESTQESAKVDGTPPLTA